MAKEKSMELTVPGPQFAIMKPGTNITEVIRENLGGETIDLSDLDRVKVPGSGGTTWTIPSIDGDIDAKAIEGIIIETQLTRVYWKTEFGDGGTSPPDCYSSDAITGIGDPGGDCVTCPYAQFKSDAKGRGQACSQRRLIFMVRENNLLPMVISAPPGSLGNAKKYLTGLSNNSYFKHHVLTRLTLEKDKNEDGIAFARIVFTKADELAEEQKAAIDKYVEFIRPYLQQAARTIAASGDNGDE